MQNKLASFENLMRKILFRDAGVKLGRIANRVHDEKERPVTVTKKIIIKKPFVVKHTRLILTDIEKLKL